MWGFFGIKDLIVLWSSYNHYPTDSNHYHVREPPACIENESSLLQLGSAFVKTPFQIFWGFSVCCGIRWTEQGYLHIRHLISGCLIQLVSNTKVKLS